MEHDPKLVQSMADAISKNFSVVIRGGARIDGLVEVKNAPHLATEALNAISAAGWVILPVGPYLRMKHHAQALVAHVMNQPNVTIIPQNET